MFEKLQNGDMVMTVTEPADKIFSLKTFNDYILGQQKTDSVIGARRKILQEKLSEIGVEYVDGNFKFTTFRFQESSVTSEDLTEALDKANEEISLMIIHLIEDDLASQNTVSPAKKEKLEYLMQQLAKDGYPVRYGMSQVRGNEMVDKSVAVSEAMVAARSFERKGAEFGQKYEGGLESRLLDTFYECSNRLVNEYGNEIKDADGFTYQIFEPIILRLEDGTEKSFPGAPFSSLEDSNTQYSYRRVINKDLVRAVRKGKFQPYVGDNPGYRDYTEATAALEVIKEYIDVLNTIDLVRPFTEAELTDNSRGKKL